MSLGSIRGNVVTIRVHRADDGSCITIEITPSSLVMQLQELLYAKTSIPIESQVLLYSGEKWNPDEYVSRYSQAQLSNINNNSNNNDNKSNIIRVFLYDVTKLQDGAPFPSPVVFPSVEIDSYFQPVPPLPNRDDSIHISPLLWELMKYENKFAQDLNKAEALFQVVAVRIEICQKCVYEQENQVKALMEALGNANDQIASLTSRWKSFKAYYDETVVVHSQLLHNFESNVEVLRQTPLHPSLVSDGRTHLIDFLPLDKLLKWVESCSREHFVFGKRVVELEQKIKLLEERLRELQTQSPEVDFEKLSSVIQEAEKRRSEVDMGLQLFRTDCTSVRDTLSKVNAGETQPSQLPDIFDALEKVDHKHRLHLNDLTSHDEAMKDMMTSVAASKTRLSMNTHQSLRSIASIQQQARDLSDSLVAVNEVMLKQKKAFFQLKYVAHMKKCYEATLAETLRRRAYGTKLTHVVTRINDVFAHLHQEELQQRLAYKNNYGAFVPKDLMPGLWPHEMPSFQLDGSALLKHDSALPSLDMLDGNGEGSTGHVASSVEIDRWLRAALTPTIPSIEAPTTLSTPTGSDNDSLSTSLLEYRHRIYTLESKLTDSYRRVQLSEKLKDEEILRLQANVKKAEDSLEESQIEVGRVSQLLQDLQNDLQDERAKLVVQSEQLKAVQSFANAQESKYQATTKEIDSLEKQLQELSTKEQSQEATLSQRASKEQELLDHVQDLENQLKSKETDQQKRDIKFISAIEKLKSNHKQISELQEEGDSLKSQLRKVAEMKQRVNDLLDRFPPSNTPLPELDDPDEMLLCRLDVGFDQLKELQENLDSARNTHRAALLALELSDRQDPTKAISFENFKAGDYMLFLPTEGTEYEAFHVHDEPKFFLNKEALPLQYDALIKERKPILGQVVEIDNDSVIIMPWSEKK